MERKKSLPNQILKLARGQRDGLVTPSDFLHLGSRAAVDKALSRLTIEGKLLRLARGLYAAPVETKFGIRGPSEVEIVRGVTRITGAAISPTGLSEANALGLTTQIPMRVIYWTNKRARRLQLGQLQIEFQPAPQGISEFTGTQGQVIRAAYYLGNDEQALNQLKQRVKPVRGSQSRNRLRGGLARSVDKIYASA